LRGIEGKTLFPNLTTESAAAAKLEEKLYFHLPPKTGRKKDQSRAEKAMNMASSLYSSECNSSFVHVAVK